MKTSFPIHVFLFAAYPVAALYAANSDEVRLVEAALVLVPVLGGAAVLWGVLFAMLRSGVRAALITTTAMVLLFQYVPAHAAVETVTGTAVSHRLLLSAALAGAGCLWFWIARAKTRTFPKVTLILNVSTFVLLAMPLTIVALDTLAASDDGELTQITLSLDPSAVDRRPDVYHILLDRYAANSTLTTHYDFDNSRFLDFLAGRGFQIAHESTANYLKTAMSLASTQNVEYLDIQGADEAGGGWAPVYARIENSSVPLLFKELGYRYVHVGSWWNPTRSDWRADRNENFYELNEFEEVLVETTILPIIRWRLHEMFPALAPNVDLAQEQREAASYAFEAIRRVAREDGPTYVYAHILMPHPPRLLDVPDEVHRHADYVERVRFVNVELSRLVTDLLAAPVKPVILLQSDEGVFPDRYQEADPDFDWRTATQEELQLKFRILNAMFLPGASGGEVYPTITPVNTYPVVFNTVFNQQFELLPDRNVAFVNEVKSLYDFFDVTELVGAAPQEASQ